MIFKMVFTHLRNTKVARISMMYSSGRYLEQICVEIRKKAKVMHIKPEWIIGFYGDFQNE